MEESISIDRLLAASEKAQRDLLSERNRKGHWTGQLASSPLSTATAISALVLAEQHGRRVSDLDWESAYQVDLSELLVESIHWLAQQQNSDGGWGDTEKSLSNIATTMLVVAAFHLTGVPAKYTDLLERAENYIRKQGGIPALRRRYGRDKTFAAPILTNCALAEIVPWKEVSPLPFELACLPQSWYRFLRLPVVSYAIPALVAIGQARYFHRKPWNPLIRVIRKLSIQRSLRVLANMQPASGGFLEATPLTSFVVMSLASVGQADHEVTRQGIEFLLGSVREDGSWPIDTNLATWNTTLAINALCDGKDQIPATLDQEHLTDWILRCQQAEEHPFTHAAPGGWAWTDLSGGVPDADDTPGALLALSKLYDTAGPPQQAAIVQAAQRGIDWLLDLQNRDNGWPTFCRGWGKLPFDRSGSDLTAHTLRALAAWQDKLPGEDSSSQQTNTPSHTDRIQEAIRTGLEYLDQQQSADGSWLPLWFGNQHLPQEENPIYGTSRVLCAYRDLNLLTTPAARNGLRYLVSRQQPDGGWGGGAKAAENGFPAQSSSTEETALATEVLLSVDSDKSLQVPAKKGLAWLISAVENDRHRESTPIGFYFAKLWYHERLYPFIFTVSALAKAVAKLQPSHSGKGAFEQMLDRH